MLSKTFKLEAEQVAWVEEHARTHGSCGAVIRNLIEQQRENPARLSLHQRSKHLIVRNGGAKDLSTRPLTGYGRD